MQKLKMLTCFESFGPEYIPKEMRKFVGNKNVAINIYRVKACDSIMSRYFCIWFIDFMLKEKVLLEYTKI